MATIKSEDFLFITGRTRSLERGLLGRERLERMAARQGYPQLALNQLLPDGQLAPLFPVEVVHKLAEAIGPVEDAAIKAAEQEAEHGQS